MNLAIQTRYFAALKNRGRIIEFIDFRDSTAGLAHDDAGGRGAPPGHGAENGGCNSADAEGMDRRGTQCRRAT
jgi:hypothetical protein